jgi:hypothetical protein
MMLGTVRGRGGALLFALALVGFAAAAHASGQAVDTGIYAMSFGRLGAVVALLVGLTGVVVGGRALARSAGRTGTGNGHRGATMAIACGLIGIALGGVIVAISPGGVGTGNGVGGGIVAMVVGLFGAVVGGLALARLRRRTTR